MRPGDSVITPRGNGIVVQLLGTPTGNGARICLMDPVQRGSGVPPVFDLGDLKPGPPLPVLEPADYVIVPGGYPGTVREVEGDAVWCSYQSKRPCLVRQGRFPIWRVMVSTLTGG